MQTSSPSSASISLPNSRPHSSKNWRIASQEIAVSWMLEWFRCWDWSWQKAFRWGLLHLGWNRANRTDEEQKGQAEPQVYRWVCALLYEKIDQGNQKAISHQVQIICRIIRWISIRSRDQSRITAHMFWDGMYQSPV